MEGVYEIKDKKRLLLNKVLTTFNEEKGIEDLRRIIKENDSEFVMKCAIYAKEKNLRKVPIIMLIELANMRNISGLKNVINKVIRRADELTFALDYQFKNYGKPIPSSLRKGLALSFNKFNEYDFGKYKNSKGDIKIRDVLFLCHPKPESKEKEELFKKIAENKLATPDTWETIISAKGSTKESWEEALSKMSYMAILRNMNNLNKVGIQIPYEKICDPEEIERSRQMPFRYYSAYKQIKYWLDVYKDGPMIKESLEKALEISTELNIKEIGGKNAILCDLSGSMRSTHGRSTITYKEIASVFAAILLKKTDSEVIGFGTTAEKIEIKKDDRVLENTEKILDTKVGGSTEGWKAIEVLRDNKIFVDRIFLLSDMELQGEAKFEETLEKYKNEVNKDLVLYSIDLVGSGKTRVPNEKTVSISGWNEGIFEMISDFENGVDVIKKIESIRL